MPVQRRNVERLKGVLIDSKTPNLEHVIRMLMTTDRHVELSSFLMGKKLQDPL